jgi:hypothetical protein
LKKIIFTLLVLVLASGGILAQELTVSGEVKTGFFWYETQIGKTKPVSSGFVHNSEDDNFDSGNYSDLNKNQGRFRLNFHLKKDNIGMKARLQTTSWDDPQVKWGYAFAYGDFFNDQLRISAGKTGDSPWGSGGPEMWKELDTAIGLRFEIMPGMVPGLNFGFAINDTNGEAAIGSGTQTLEDVLRESVLGLAYTHEYFLLRFAYRLDADYDAQVGDQMLYRIEERIIQKYLPHFQIWANGFFDGMNTGGENKGLFTNWLYVQYDPDIFTAQIRFGFDADQQVQILYARPSFYYHFFGGFLSVGAAFEFANDFGEGKMDTSTPYLRWFIEPQIRLNFGSAALAFVYRYKDDYERWDPDSNSSKKIRTTTNIINLRMVYTF